MQRRQRLRLQKPDRIKPAMSLDLTPAKAKEAMLERTHIDDAP